MPDEQAPVPVATPRSRAHHHLKGVPAKLALSLLGAAILTGYIYLFFWHIPLWFSSVEEAVYSWGGALAVIFVVGLLKLPRITTQESGDEWTPVSEVLMLLAPFAILLFIAGRASTPAMAFPRDGQFAFWFFLGCTVIGIVVNIYISVRLAERTFEGGGQ